MEIDVKVTEIHPGYMARIEHDGWFLTVVHDAGIWHFTGTQPVDQRDEIQPWETMAPVEIMDAFFALYRRWSGRAMVRETGTEGGRGDLA